MLMKQSLSCCSILHSNQTITRPGMETIGNVLLAKQYLRWSSIQSRIFNGSIHIMSEQWICMYTFWSLIMGFVILNTVLVNLRLGRTSSIELSGKILVKVCHQVGHKRQLRFCPTGSDHQYGWDVGLPGHCHSKITLSSFQNIFLFNIWCTLFWRPCVTRNLSWIFSSKTLEGSFSRSIY